MPHVNCISILNQEGQKQGFKVEYTAESKGFAHALQWEVSALGIYPFNHIILHGTDPT